MFLKTERLNIRRVMESDWQSIREIWIDFNLSPYAQYDKPHNIDADDVRERIARWAQASQGREHIFFVACLQNTVIGYIAFNIRENGSYEIGYCFHSDYHGMGYAKESHIAALEYMTSLGIKHFTAGTAIRNLPSVKLLKSLGFAQIGEEKVSFYKDENGNDIVFDGGIFELILE